MNLVYVMKNGGIELVYIGSSGKVQNNGQIKHRDGGLYARIVNDHQFWEIPRKRSWKRKLTDEQIEALDVYWYSTFDNENTDIPAYTEAIIMQRFYEIYGCLHRWEKEF